MPGFLPGKLETCPTKFLRPRQPRPVFMNNRTHELVSLPVPAGGSLRGDLFAAAQLMAEAMGEQDLALMTGIFAAMRTDRDLADALRCDLFADKHSLTEGIFTRAAARGDAGAAKVLRAQACALDPRYEAACD